MFLTFYLCARSFQFGLVRPFSLSTAAQKSQFQQRDFQIMCNVFSAQLLMASCKHNRIRIYYLNSKCVQFVCTKLHCSSATAPQMLLQLHRKTILSKNLYAIQLFFQQFPNSFMHGTDIIYNFFRYKWAVAGIWDI